MESLSPPINSTTIQEVNDYCLREVFSHLSVGDLAIVADVCTRFRQNAKAHLEFSKRDALKRYYFSIDSRECESQKLLRISRELRNFGPLFKSIDGYVSKSYLWRKAMELLKTYCSGTILNLTLCEFKISGEIAMMLRPVLASVQELTLSGGQWDALFLWMLPEWSPDLRKLTLEYINPHQISGLHQAYPKLTKLKLTGVDEAKNSDIEEFLKRNPQLKQISIITCDRIDNNIFKSIATYTPQIEKIHFFSNVPIQHNNEPICGQLNYLKELRMEFNDLGHKNYNVDDADNIIKILDEIGSAGISLRKLDLRSVDFNLIVNGGRRFVEAISKLKKLECLKMNDVCGLSATDFTDICDRLPELAELTLKATFPTLNSTNVLNLIRFGKRLQKITFYGARPETKLCIDGDMYMKFVNVVQNRSEKIHLLIKLFDFEYTTNVPKELIKKYKDVLTLKI